MAEINGTQVADTIPGTSLDDVIFGFGGGDIINGASGNDTIDGGAGADNILGGAGNDTIVVALASDLTDDATLVGTTQDVIDGGADIDTLVTNLLATDVIKNDGSTGKVWGVSGVKTDNLEFVKVSNSSNFMLDLSSDAAFGVDLAALSGAGALNLEILDYTALGGAVSANVITDLTAGVIVGGVTYMNTESFVTADGGTVTVGQSGTNYTFSYVADAVDTYAVGVSGNPVDDIVGDSVVATVTLTDGSTVDVAVDLSLDLSATFDASGATAGIMSKGDFQANNMTGSDFDDVIWAGADATNENDTLRGGKGNDTLAGGGGADVIDGGADNDTIFAGADNDVAVNGGLGDDRIFGGTGADTLNGDALAGGDGAVGDGNDTIFGGADDGIDTIYGNGGNDTIYGGAGVDILDGGIGNDIIFNGAGNDTSVKGGAGDDTLWGGAGNDTLTGGTGNDTFAFIAGNGNDTVFDFDFGILVPTSNDVLDLTAFGFADIQDVLDSMSDVSGVATLNLAPGQTLTFTTFAKSDFQAAVDDWVLV
jgi:Ca2+-binding RTX toxin-like protein